MTETPKPEGAPEAVAEPDAEVETIKDLDVADVDPTAVRGGSGPSYSRSK